VAIRNGPAGNRGQAAWAPPPAAPSLTRTEVSWVGPVGTGARIASALRGWNHLRYEVTEEASRGSDGGRWSHTPDLGIFHAQTDVHGNAVVPEDRIRAAMSHAGGPLPLRRDLDLALGQAWDDELEPFRYAGEGVPYRWWHRVGERAAPPRARAAYAWINLLWCGDFQGRGSSGLMDVIRQRAGPHDPRGGRPRKVGNRTPPGPLARKGGISVCGKATPMPR